MRFSIIVPIYGVQEYINECVDSVLNQSFTDFELILVDDGSPDECPLLCDQYAVLDSRVHVIHKTNGGLVSARKAGAKIAKGEYSMCLDGDDYLEPFALEYVNAVVENERPDVITFGYYQVQPNQKTSIPIRNFREGYYSKQMIEKEIFPSLITRNKGKAFPSCIWGECIKTSLYREEQLAVPDEIKIGEDYAVTRPIIYRANSLYILNECIYCYRSNPASMTKEKKPLNLDNYEVRYNHIVSRIDISKYNFHAQLCENTLHGLFNALVSQFYSTAPISFKIKTISNTLDKTFCKECVSKAKYNTFSRKFMLCVLKYRLYSIMWLYSKLK